MYFFYDPDFHMHRILVMPLFGAVKVSRSVYELETFTAPNKGITKMRCMWKSGS